MAYIIDQSCVGFQQGGWVAYTSQPVAFNGHPSTYEYIMYRPQKQALKYVKEFGYNLAS